MHAGQIGRVAAVSISVHLRRRGAVQGIVGKCLRERSVSRSEAALRRPEPGAADGVALPAVSVQSGSSVKSAAKRRVVTSTEARPAPRGARGARQMPAPRPSRPTRPSRQARRPPHPREHPERPRIAGDAPGGPPRRLPRGHRRVRSRPASIEFRHAATVPEGSAARRLHRDHRTVGDGHNETVHELVYCHSIFGVEVAGTASPRSCGVTRHTLTLAGPSCDDWA